MYSSVKKEEKWIEGLRKRGWCEKIQESIKKNIELKKKRRVCTSRATTIACQFITTATCISTRSWRGSSIWCSRCCCTRVSTRRLHTASQIIKRQSCQFNQSVNGTLIEMRNQVPVRTRHAFPASIPFVAFGTRRVRDETRISVIANVINAAAVVGNIVHILSFPITIIIIIIIIIVVVSRNVYNVCITTVEFS